MIADEAYAEVERITRKRARNFAYGIMLLPKPKRRAIAAVYAFAREVDDVADDPELSAEAKRERLEALQVAIEEPPGDDPMLVALADARARYPIPARALHDLIDGGLMDLEKARYADFDELREYCRRVAGAVGVACIAVYGAARGGLAALEVLESAGWDVFTQRPRPSRARLARAAVAALVT